MTTFENLTPAEALEIFTVYLFNESKGYMDRSNARYQINISDEDDMLENGHKLLRVLMI